MHDNRKERRRARLLRAAGRRLADIAFVMLPEATVSFLLLRAIPGVPLLILGRPGADDVFMRLRGSIHAYARSISWVTTTKMLAATFVMPWTGGWSRAFTTTSASSPRPEKAKTTTATMTPRSRSPAPTPITVRSGSQAFFGAWKNVIRFRDNPTKNTQ